jgi:predicted nucleic acid-binding protein
LTEVGDAMSAPRDRQRFLRLGNIIEYDPNTIIVPTADELYRKGVTLFGDRPDKAWSLTDCISFVVMKERSISEALIGDHHFEQAGFVALLAN